MYPPVLPASILQHSVSTDFNIYTNQMQTQHFIDKKMCQILQKQGASLSRLGKIPRLSFMKCSI